MTRQRKVPYLLALGMSLAILWGVVALPVLAEDAPAIQPFDQDKWAATYAGISATKALEVLTGEALATWVQREIFQPLGLQSTRFSPPPAAQSSIPPTEEDTTLRHRLIQGEVQDENAWLLGGIAGHAGLFSNVGDLLSFAGEILDATARSANARVLDAATVELFAQRQGPTGSSRALGWDTPSENSSSGHHFSAHSIGHLGFSGCSLWIDLDARIAIALLTNRTWPDRQSQGIREVRPAFHDALRQAL